MRPIVFNILLMLLLCRIGTEVSVAQTVEPLKDRGDVLHVACLKEGAELRSEADITAQVVENVAWMTHYVAVETKTDSTSRNWVKVGKYISLSEAEPVGWMLKDHLLMRMEANKKEGIYEKAIVVVHYDRQNRAIGGAPVRRAP
jgi:hypothetical protein